jgi:hypothetical protein
MAVIIQAKAEPVSTQLAQRFDRLSIVTLLSSLWYFQVFGFRGLDPEYSLFTGSNLLGAVLILLPLAGIVENRLPALLLINAAILIPLYVVDLPIASNNEIMGVFFSLTVLVASAPLVIRHRFRVWDIDRDVLFDAIAGPGRWLLAIMYFYGVYHKINADFLNPEVSCGVVLYRALVAPFGLDNWAFGQWSAIWATFVIETAAMILLFTPRYKKIGFIIGVPFHIIIGWSGYGYYMDFSTIVMATYALFLPAAAPKAFLATAARWAGSEERALTYMRGLTIAAVLVMLLYIAMVDGWRGLNPNWRTFVHIFTIYALLFYAFVVCFVPWHSEDNLPVFNFRPRFAAFLPILFFINGASPYLGLKTENTISMFSNLHTEGRETNHLIHGVLPFGADYQDDIVRIISTSDPEAFTSKFDTRSGIRTLSDNVGFVRFEFDRILASHPGLEVTFLYQGKEHTNGTGWQNSYLSASWFERTFFMFKPVDFERPKICTH